MKGERKMKLSETKKKKLNKLLQDSLHDEELIDVEIEVVGYRDYEVTNFETSLDANKILKGILKIIEE